MKKFIYLAILLLITQFSFAQKKAVTEDGDTIFVYADGTWSFELLESGTAGTEFDFLSAELKLDTIKQEQQFSKKATSVVKNSFGLFTLRYDPEKWKREPPAQYNEDAEFALIARDKDIYCIVISEEVEIGAENIVKIALNTMRENTNAEVELVKTEVRTVNEKDLIRAVYNVDLSGMNLTFDSYYYSSEKGTIQFTTWTGQNIWEKYEDEIIDFLNGLIIN